MSGIVYPPNWRDLLDCPVFAGSDADPADFRARLDASIRESFAALPVTKALCLSGGVDSSALAAVLSALGYYIPCLTLHDSPDHPDLLAATKVASGLSLPHLTRRITQRPSDLYDALFATLAELDFRGSIHGDTVDEMQGGYPAHRWPQDGDVVAAFEHHWGHLYTAHLEPMDRAAQEHGGSVALPYLAMSEYLTALPMSSRVNGVDAKIAIKSVARAAGLPTEIVDRRKIGLVDAIRRVAHG